MKLFHQLEESDQHNAIHYCMHNVVEDMLDDGVQIEAFSDADKEMKTILENVVIEALALEEDNRFEFLTGHETAGQFVFDIALDMARAAYYHPDEDMVIHYESLRDHMHGDDDDSTEVSEDMIENIEDIVETKKIDKNKLN